MDPRLLFLLAQPDAHEPAHQAPLATRRGLTFVYLFISALSALDNRRPLGITSRSQVASSAAFARVGRQHREPTRHYATQAPARAAVARH